MIVDTNSWRYRAIQEYSPFYPARSLCGYFWQVAGWIFIVGNLIPFAITALVSAPFVLKYGEAFYTWAEGLPYFFEVYLVVTSALGVVAWFIGVGVGIIYGVGYLWGDFFEDKYREYKHRRYERMLNATPPEPGLFRQWVKARKAQLCPIIEYKDLSNEG